MENDNREEDLQQNESPVSLKKPDTETGTAEQETQGVQGKYVTPDYTYQNAGHNQNSFYQNGDNAQNVNQGVEGYGIASMICGILSLVAICCIPYINVILSIISIVLGIIALNKEISSNGRTMAIVGIVTSVLAILFIIMITVAFVIFAVNVATVYEAATYGPYL